MVKPTSTEKADRSPVTVADYASQAVICQGLADAFPDDPVVAEETSEGLRAPDQTEMLAQVTHYVGRCVRLDRSRRRRSRAALLDAGPH
jgi:3'(2'), 5'-bisphosphate nucleotidase